MFCKDIEQIINRAGARYNTQPQSSHEWTHLISQELKSDEKKLKESEQTHTAKNNEYAQQTQEKNKTDKDK